MLLIIINVLFVWILPVKSAYYDTFASNKVRLLEDGNIIPALAFGTAMNSVHQLDEVPRAVYLALKSGFRHIDTAASYTTEDLVAQAVQKAINHGIVTRKEIFITTKLDLDVNKGKKVVEALELALKRLQLDYVDLFLIHTPYNLLEKNRYDLLDIWTGMEEAKSLGLTKSIGVSNFEIEHLNQILPYCVTRPAVNEIEVNPTFNNAELVEYCQNEGIIVIAYGPFGYLVPRPFGTTKYKRRSLDDPVLKKIAKKYGVTTSQVVLRYMIDRGTIPLTMSTNEQHMQLNVDIFDFCLTDEEVEMINEFNLDTPVYGNDRAIRERIVADYEIRLEYANRRNRKLY